MQDKIVASDFNTRRGDDERCNDPVCIHTDKIYDQCRDKDCLTDLRVFVMPCGQEIIDRAINVKLRKAEIIWVYSDIEPVQFNRGYYSVDLKFFFKVTLDAFTGIGKPCKVEGLATFDKKVILFGSEGSAKVFSSSLNAGGLDHQNWQKTNMPKAIIEVVEPIALSSKIVDPEDKSCCCCCCDDMDISTIPDEVCNVFDDNFVMAQDARRVYISIGVFSIVKLERSVQLMIPSYEFCVPSKECVAATDEDPCDLFERIEFPVDEFFPPVRCDDNGGCGCSCDN